MSLQSALPVILCVVCTSLLPNAGFAADELVDFASPRSIESRRPILVAHRGGVVTQHSPECSSTAIRLAAKQGYDMVELDVRRSRDGIPVVFHDDSLKKACGKDGRVSEFTAAELESIGYLASEDRIARLDTALEMCRKHRLGVMLDLKAGRDSAEFLGQLRRLVEKHGLIDATITFSGSDTARRVLKGIRFTPTDDEMRRLRGGEKISLGDRFWFGIPQRLQPGDIAKLKAAGALIIPAINTFRYPADEHFELAKRDIQQLTQQGIDGFQIDSVYSSLFDTLD